MNADWILTSAPVAGLAVDCVAQIIVAHLSKRVPLSIVAGAACGMAATIALTWLGMATVATWVLLILTYSALAFNYWAFVNLNVTSVRIRLIREILRHPQGISRKELFAQYSAEEFLRRRLERLQQGSKQFSYDGGRWRLRKRTLLVAAQILAALRAFIIPRRREE